MAVDPNRAIARAMAVSKLDVDTFEEVEADETSTAEAGAVLVVSTLIGSFGSLFTGGVWQFIATNIALIGGWYVWAWASAEIAKRLFMVRTTDTGEMLRVIGYGSAPRVLGLVPILGSIVAFFWTLTAQVVGIRQAGEMTTGQAVITAFGGLIPTVIAYGMILSFL